MKRNYRSILFHIFLFQFINIISAYGQGFLINDVKTLKTREAIINKKYSDIEGNPYYPEKFIQSTVFLKDGNYANLPLWYDLFQDEMEFMRGEKIMWVIKKDVKFIRFGSDTLLVFPAANDSTRLGYYFLKSQGKYLLYYRKSVSFKQMENQKGYSDLVSNRFINEKDEVFIRQGNMPPRKIRTKKDLMEYFTGDRAAIGFIKKQRIRAEKIKDLQKLVSYLNGI